MKNDYYIALIYKNLKGEINPDEQKQLDDFLQQSEENKQLQKELEITWKLSQVKEELPFEVDVEADLKSVNQKLDQFNPVEKQSNEVKRKIIPLWQKVAAIAAMLAIGFFAMTWLTNATGNGNIQQFSSGKLTKEIRLPDGSIVVLNKESTLSYPSNFNQKNRAVQLQGEAFFEVEKNKDLPFTIAIQETNVRVLGTSFNVKEDIKNQQISVAVKTGHVEFYDQNNKVNLLANDQSTYDSKSKKFSSPDQPIDNALRWKTKQFVFNDQELLDVIHTIETYFNIQIKLENQALSTCKISAVINSLEQEEVLEKIAKSVAINLEKKDAKNFIFKNGNCQ